MGQVSRELNSGPPNGGLRHNLDNYIRQKSPWERGGEKFTIVTLRTIVITISYQTQGAQYKPFEAIFH